MVIATLSTAATIEACGARSDLGALGVGGASSSTAAVTSSASTTTASVTAGVGGNIPTCTPPDQGEVVAMGLGAPIDLVLDGHIAYLLTDVDVTAVPLCGGTPRVVAHQKGGAVNVPSLSLVGDHLRWGSDDASAGSTLFDATTDGTSVISTPAAANRLIGVVADDQGVYWARDDGALKANQNAALTGVVGPIAASAPLFVDQGWVYFAFSTGSAANGSMIRVRTDGSSVAGIDPPSIPVPTDFVVDGQQIFMVQEAASELRLLDLGTPVVKTLAVLAGARGIALDANYLYVADDQGVERAHRDGSLVELLWGGSKVVAVAQGLDAVAWIDAAGTLSWRRKPQ